MKHHLYSFSSSTQKLTNFLRFRCVYVVFSVMLTETLHGTSLCACSNQLCTLTSMNYCCLRQQRPVGFQFTSMGSILASSWRSQWHCWVSAKRLYCAAGYMLWQQSEGCDCGEDDCSLRAPHEPNATWHKCEGSYSNSVTTGRLTTITTLTTTQTDGQRQSVSSCL